MRKINNKSSCCVSQTFVFHALMFVGGRVAHWLKVCIKWERWMVHAFVICTFKGIFGLNTCFLYMKHILCKKVKYEEAYDILELAKMDQAIDYIMLWNSICTLPDLLVCCIFVRLTCFRSSKTFNIKQQSWDQFDKPHPALMTTRPDESRRNLNENFLTK